MNAQINLQLLSAFSPEVRYAARTLTIAQRLAGLWIWTVAMVGLFYVWLGYRAYASGQWARQQVADFQAELQVGEAIAALKPALSGEASPLTCEYIPASVFDFEIDSPMDSDIDLFELFPVLRGQSSPLPVVKAKRAAGRCKKVVA